jgi:hypothetical protein
LSGVVRDASGAPVFNARVAIGESKNWAATDAFGRFRIPDVMPGELELQIRTPSLDVLNVTTRYPVVFADSTRPIAAQVPAFRDALRSLCGDRASPDRGLLLGNARWPDSRAMSGLPVRASWVLENGEPRLIEARTSATGGYIFCGVPTNRPISLYGEAPGAASAPASVRVPSSQRYARVDLVLDSTLVARASLSGTVLTDSTQRPIADAEVAILDLGLATTTSKTGLFHLEDIPAGNHRLRIRKIGYGMLDTLLEFSPGKSTRRSIYLSPVVVLDSVKVTGRMRDPGMEDFWENRRIGLGHFYTREQIAAFDDRHVADFLAQTPGMLIARGTAEQAWVQGHGRASVPPFMVNPEDATAGAKNGCYAMVYLDDMLVFDPGRKRDPSLKEMRASAPPLFDVNSISPSQIEAIEFYSGPGQIPARYMKLDTPCGVLVIHTRR